MKSMVNFEIGW